MHLECKAICDCYRLGQAVHLKIKLPTIERKDISECVISLAPFIIFAKYVLNGRMSRK